MSSSLLVLPAGISAYCLAGLVVSLLVATKLTQPSKLDAIFTVGSTSWLGSWLAGFKFVTNALDVIREGYVSHKRMPFKVAALQSWMVILGSPRHVEELRNAPDCTLSFLEGINDLLQIEFTVGHGIHHNPYHIPILRSQLNRNIGVLYPEIRNEIVIAVDEVLNLRGNEWKSIPAFSYVQQIVCRVSNRVFVGLPLCRDPDWIDLNIQYTDHVVKGAMATKLFPVFLKPLAARLFTKLTESKHRARKLLGPVIEERQRYLDEYGSKWPDKPNDLLSWLMDEAKGVELTVESLTSRMLFTIFASINSTSTSFTNALFYLAANPQYIFPLREEVEAIVGTEGWSHASLSKMQKVDSFLKECERMEGFTGVGLIRKALKDYTFWDGTFVPKGTLIAAPIQSIHRDDEYYPNAHTFMPFRFSDLRQQDEENTTYHFVSTTNQFLVFGHGRHACPGRFLAASELKSLLAHVVMEYDVKLADGAMVPRSVRLATSLAPDPNAKVMFRKRVDE